MNEPLVSVILPVYNRAHLLAAAAKSVLDQDYRNLEILVVDDASKDDLPAAVSALNDPRVRYLRRDSNGGPNAARNSGIEAARGDLIAFQDSDDLWLPGKLRKQVEMLLAADADVAFIYTNVSRFTDGQWRVCPGDQLPVRSGDMHEAALLNGVLFSFTQTWLARKSALLAVGLFDPGFKRWGDWDLCLRLTRRYKVGYLPGVHVTSPRIADSLTNNMSLCAPAIRRIIDKHVQHPARGSHGAARIHYTLARFEFLYGNRRSAWAPLLRSIAIRPSLKAFALLGLALFHLEGKAIGWRHRSESNTTITDPNPSIRP